MTVEVCVTSLESALIAQRAGAQRIELCAELSLGGITPSYGLVSTVRESLQIPVHVLVRPRSGDFTYSEQEFVAMKRDIESCRSLGVDGIVSGALKEDRTVDWEKTSELLNHSAGMSFTFHRAFDWVPDPVETFLRLQEIGVQTLLTSGQSETAEKGLGVLRKLLNRSAGCTVMPGGGINERNASRFKEEGFDVLHLSASRPVVNTPDKHPLPMRAANFPPENHVLKTDPQILRKVIESVN